VTDPPFFDNVHYSELADFFFAWQRLYPRGFIADQITTRHLSEVQDGNAERFTLKLEAVFQECYRVLKPNGLLVFTYHHSRSEGWTSLAEAIVGSGFSITNAHPVKAEMSVATPKTQAKSPIQFDMVIVCKKRIKDARPMIAPEVACQLTAQQLPLKVARLISAGLSLSRNDLRIIAMSHFISMLGPISSANDVIRHIINFETTLDQIADLLWRDHSLPTKTEMIHPQQLSLF
jgi:putative DNA methylase